MRGRRLTRALLGAVALAVAPAWGSASLAGAQDPRPSVPPDTVVADTAVVPDTLPAGGALRRQGVQDSARGDTLQPPLPQGEIPPLPAIGPEYRWVGDEIFATGALTLLDLLDGLPEVTGIRTGWLLPPEHATVAGAFGRIRIFLDGVELDELNPRLDGLHDLGMVQLWPLEEVAVERGVDELRVHLRSRRAEHTTAITRVDVQTGDYGSDLYRGYFDRRFGRGEVLQFAGQQFSTRDPRFGGDGDRLSLVARLGVARTSWSVDGWLQRTSGFRSELDRLEDRTPLASLEAAHTVAYGRLAWRAPSHIGLWAQAIASTQKFAETSGTGSTTPGGEDGDEEADTTRSRAQYVGTLGWGSGPFSLSATGRLRVYEGKRLLTPSLRAGYAGSRLALSAYAERRDEDDRTRLDATARVTPVPFLALSGGVASERAEDGETVNAMRAEAGVRVRDLWVVGGVIAADNRPTGAPTGLDPDFVSFDTDDARGLYVGLRGRLWRGFTVDVTATTWSDVGGLQVYRPEFDVSGRVEYLNQWLSRFPRGNFHVRAALFGTYASDVVFPTAIGGNVVGVQTVSAPGLNALLEIRISDAVIMLQYRNMLGVDYETVPGYVMPQPAILYGARWTFRN